MWIPLRFPGEWERSGWERRADEAKRIREERNSGAENKERQSETGFLGMRMVEDLNKQHLDWLGLWESDAVLEEAVGLVGIGESSGGIGEAATNIYRSNWELGLILLLLHWEYEGEFDSRERWFGFRFWKAGRTFFCAWWEIVTGILRRCVTRQILCRCSFIFESLIH